MNNLYTIVDHFNIEGKINNIEVIQNGLINHTYHIYTTTNQYLLQQVNTKIFLDMEGLMDNINKITSFLKQKGIMTLSIIPTKEGRLYEGNYRMYAYIENTFTYDTCDSLDAFYLNGKCFGRFHADLLDFRGKLVDTIPHFHDTTMRYEQFEKAIKLDLAKRKDEVEDQIRYLQENKAIAYLEMDQSYIAHNDAKLSNVLFDIQTNNPVCIIDLDTMMNGSIGYDYGDVIRSGANTTKEDDANLEIIDFDEIKFQTFTQGFIDGLGNVDHLMIDELEKGIYVMIYEQALRFLTDYLNGDTYYAIQYKNHNLDRANNQIQLLKKTLEKREMIHHYLDQFRG